MTPAVPETAVLSAPQKARADAMLDGGEVVILHLRPGAWYVARAALRWIPAGIAAAVFLAMLAEDRAAPFSAWHGVAVGAGVVAVRATVQFVDWCGREYLLTDRRIMVGRGTHPVSIPLADVARVSVRASRLRRLVRSGDVQFWRTSSRGAPACAWDAVRDPEVVRRKVLETMSRYHHRRRHASAG